MKLLLIQNSLYAPSYGGANKANRIVCEALAHRGHQCVAMASTAGSNENVAYLRQLEKIGASDICEESAELSFSYHLVKVHSYRNWTALVTDLSRKIHDVRPDYIIVSSEDPFQVILRAVLVESSVPVVYFAHTLLLLPFGPGAMAQFPPGADAIRRCAGVVSFSRFSQEYMLRWGTVRSTLVRIPWFGNSTYADLRYNPGRHVLMINPCAVKGLSIFAGLAERFPAVPFAAVPTWGTTVEDRELLQRLPNVILVAPADDVEVLFRMARLLLVPSLWQETFGLIATEAMLRGVPVVASNIGGLPEAKLGVDYMLDVEPIRHYRSKLDSRCIPVPEVPPQNLEPWAAVLSRLLADEAHRAEIATSSRTEAIRFLEQCKIENLENYLTSL